MSPIVILSLMTRDERFSFALLSLEGLAIGQEGEVQDGDADRFAHKLRAGSPSAAACCGTTGCSSSRITTPGPKVGGRSRRCSGAGFHFVNAHPVKAEMSVATPKFQAKEPIQLDVILVCRKRVPSAA